jgi:hypothetical protein
MAVIERHISPDGLLQLIVDRTDDGDWGVGFDKFAWHTHGDLLAYHYGGSPEAAIQSFVSDVISSRRVIVISRIDGKIHDVWITDKPSSDETKYAYRNETIEKRLWDGRQLFVEKLSCDSTSRDR